ncbi:MAG TPA: DUF2235 domain-containing protein [Cyclobacteriaceae bacterium]|nr:DUF2235 domain-containing protein [Cyclobacteriaceae bacterium]
MPKNIIICCDGTGNQLKETYSNVVKLFMIAEKSEEQLAYYDPGVGTMSDPNIVNPFWKTLSKVGGLAFGWGLRANVSEAYGFLMDYYVPGDRVYLYGFSRGAYTVRVLAGLIHIAGLLQKGSQHLIPYAWEVYRKSFDDKVKKVADQFKETYSRPVDIHFLGAWDTVTSIGIFNRTKLPFTTFNPGILNIRHAVAIDEKRTYYRQNLFGQNKTQDVKQVWFAGVHSDVGGSYALTESGLSQITLQWMLRESEQFKLKINEAAFQKVLGGDSTHCKPDIKQAIHRSLSAGWWTLEVIPRYRKRGFPVYVPLSRPRTMSKDMFGNDITPTIHVSVVEKIKLGNGYRPKNVEVDKCNVEE